MCIKLRAPIHARDIIRPYENTCTRESRKVAWTCIQEADRMHVLASFLPNLVQAGPFHFFRMCDADREAL